MSAKQFNIYKGVTNSHIICRNHVFSFGSRNQEILWKPEITAALKSAAKQVKKAEKTKERKKIEKVKKSC